MYKTSTLCSKERKGPVHWPRPELLPHAGEGRGSLQKRRGEKVGQTGGRDIMTTFLVGSSLFFFFFFAVGE